MGVDTALCTRSSYGCPAADRLSGRSLFIRLMLNQTTANPPRTPGADIAAAADPRRWWILATCCTVGFAQLAEPQLWMIGLEIPASAFGTAWHEYRLYANLGVVLFVAFQLIGGVLGDLLGRRRILLIGAVGCSLGNVLSLFAWNLPSLIGMHGIVGLMGALAFPLTLAIVRVTFVGSERSFALLIYVLVTSVGILASLLAIPLRDRFGWRAALVLPIVTGIVGIVLAWRHLPESRAQGGIRRVEAILVAAWTMVFLAVSFGLAVARTSGTLRNPITIASCGAGILGLLVILYWSGRVPQPGRRRRDGPPLFLSMLLLVTAMLSFALSGYLLQLYQFFHTVEQHSVFVSGFALTPIFAINLVVLRWAARFAFEQPKRVVICLGLLAMGTAMLLTALARPGLPYLLLVPGMALFGIGFLLASTAWTYFFFSALPQDLIGVSTGINRAAVLVGSTLAIVILNNVLQFSGLTDFHRRIAALDLTAQQQAQALDALNATLQLGVTASDTTQTPEVIAQLALLSAYRESYSVGISSALVTAGILCLLCSVVTWFWLSRSTEAAALIEPDEQPAEKPAMK
jgi:MFS family permease